MIIKCIQDVSRESILDLNGESGCMMVEKFGPTPIGTQCTLDMFHIKMVGLLLEYPDVLMFPEVGLVYIVRTVPMGCLLPRNHE